MNRQERRIQQAAARRMAATWPDHLVQIAKSEWPAHPPGPSPAPIEAWRSRDFVVLVYASGRVSIRSTAPGGRHDLTWDDLQRIKREIGRGASWAIEVYPADDGVVNVAPMRHLWLLEGRPYGVDLAGDRGDQGPIRVLRGTP